MLQHSIHILHTQISSINDTLVVNDPKQQGIHGSLGAYRGRLQSGGHATPCLMNSILELLHVHEGWCAVCILLTLINISSKVMHVPCVHNPPTRRIYNPPTIYGKNAHQQYGENIQCMQCTTHHLVGIYAAHANSSLFLLRVACGVSFSFVFIEPVLGILCTGWGGATRFKVLWYMLSRGAHCF